MNRQCTPSPTDTRSDYLCEAEQMRDVVVQALEEGKGQDIMVLDVTTLTDVCDYMVVVSGASDRQIRTLAEKVLDRMRQAGWYQIGLEGEHSREWVLVDFVDVVVHIMRRETRKRYDLESLWDPTFGTLQPQEGIGGNPPQNDRARSDEERTPPAGNGFG